MDGACSSFPTCTQGRAIYRNWKEPGDGEYLSRCCPLIPKIPPIIPQMRGYVGERSRTATNNEK